MAATVLELDFSTASPINKDIVEQVNSIRGIKPKGQREAVLKLLIVTNGISEQGTGYNGYRGRISELKKHPYNVNIRTVRIDFITDLDKKSKYNRHFLLDADKVEAIRIFKEINK